jgi:hypothetical protein
VAALGTRLHLALAKPDYIAPYQASAQRMFFAMRIRNFHDSGADETGGDQLRVSRTACRSREEPLHAKFRHPSAARRPANSTPAFRSGELARFREYGSDSRGCLDWSSHGNGQGTVSKRMIATSGCSMYGCAYAQPGAKPIEPGKACQQSIYSLACPRFSHERRRCRATCRRSTR